MFNKDKIKELEKDIAFHKKYAGIRQDKLLAVRLENEGLRAELAGLRIDIKGLMDEIVIDEKLISMMKQEQSINISPYIWIKGEPKKQGWYFTDKGALFYNPAARCKWMRGEKGNAERFEGKVIAYIEAPEDEVEK